MPAEFRSNCPERRSRIEVSIATEKIQRYFSANSLSEVAGIDNVRRRLTSGFLQARFATSPRTPVQIETAA